MQRQIIHIDEDLCNGCGECVPSCAEGAIQIIDGKAKLVKDALCDGLGACLGDCPEGALTIETRDADGFDEELVEEHLATLNKDQAPAHAPAPPPMAAMHAGGGGLALGGGAQAHGGMGGCPGSRAMSFDSPDEAPAGDDAGTRPSQLKQWPVQLHLVSPTAPYFQGADVLLCADCVPFAMGDFHKDWLQGRALAIACPKLDQGQEMYLQKLVSMIDDARIDTLSVMIMQVPCCGGLLHLATEAAARARRKVPVKKIVIGLQGEVLAEEWA